MPGDCMCVYVSEVTLLECRQRRARCARDCTRNPESRRRKYDGSDKDDRSVYPLFLFW